MPFYRWSGSAWEAHLVRLGKPDGTFTVDTDEVYGADVNRAWHLIQPAVLAPVENLAATGIDDTSATVSWTLPAQQLTPNHVQVRMPLVSGEWLDYTYPKTSFSSFSLVPQTTYTVEVRLAYIDNYGSLYSAVRTASFKTTWTTTPGPAAPGSTNTKTTVPIPPLTAPSCVWQWHLEHLEFGGGWTVVGTPPVTTLPAGATEVTVDAVALGLTSGDFYRVCLRTLCQPGNVKGPWVCGDAFQVPASWATPCADQVDPRWATAPFTDATVLIPKVCAPDVVRELRSNVVLAHGPRFDSLCDGYDNTPDSVGILAAAGPDTDIVLQGVVPQMSDVGPDGTWVVYVNAPAWPTGFCSIGRFGGTNLGVFTDANGSVPYVETLTVAADGSFHDLVLTGSTASPMPTGRYVGIAGRCDDTNKALTLFMLDGTTHTQIGTMSTVGLTSTTSTDNVLMALPGAAKGAFMAAWDRVLTDDEMGWNISDDYLVAPDYFSLIDDIGFGDTNIAQYLIAAHPEQTNMVMAVMLGGPPNAVDDLLQTAPAYVPPVATKASGRYDAYIVARDSNNIVQWFHHLVSSPGAGNVYVSDVQMDYDGSVLVAGSVSAAPAAVTFPDGFTNPHPNGAYGWWAKISPTGTWLWTVAMGGSNSGTAASIGEATGFNLQNGLVPYIVPSEARDGSCIAGCAGVVSGSTVNYYSQAMAPNGFGEGAAGKFLMFRIAAGTVTWAAPTNTATGSQQGSWSIKAMLVEADGTIWCGGYMNNGTAKFNWQGVQSPVNASDALPLPSFVVFRIDAVTHVADLDQWMTCNQSATSFNGNVGHMVRIGDDIWHTGVAKSNQGGPTWTVPKDGGGGISSQSISPLSGYSQCFIGRINRLTGLWKAFLVDAMTSQNVVTPILTDNGHAACLFSRPSQGGLPSVPSFRKRNKSLNAFFERMAGDPGSNISSTAVVGAGRRRPTGGVEGICLGDLFISNSAVTTTMTFPDGGGVFTQPRNVGAVIDKHLFLARAGTGYSTVAPGTLIGRYEFGYTGAVQTVTAPPGATTMTVRAVGAAGAGGQGGQTFAGKGHQIVASGIGLLAGQSFEVRVGGCPGASRFGGYNGGGNAGTTNGGFDGGGGGGATDVRSPGGDLTQRIVIAGGGGGAGASGSPYISTGGDGGWSTGLDGQADPPGPFCGRGGTATAGGAGYPGGGSSDGSLGFGGSSIDVVQRTGGGGGGGYYGGGAGQNSFGLAAGGGGGGSSRALVGTAFAGFHNQATNTGHGLCIIDFYA